jgi:hypothetical protein
MRKHHPTNLGFDIAETSTTTKDTPKSYPDKSPEAAHKEHSRNHIEDQRKDITGWIATVILQAAFCSLDIAFEADLNNSSTVPDNLKVILEAHGFPLTEPATFVFG